MNKKCSILHYPESLVVSRILYPDSPIQELCYIDLLAIQ